MRALAELGKAIFGIVLGIACLGVVAFVVLGALSLTGIGSPRTTEAPTVQETTPAEDPGQVAPPATDAPAPSAEPEPTTPVPEPVYANCTDVWNAIGRPIYPDDPGWDAAKFDRDATPDGIGCEVDPR